MQKWKKIVAVLLVIFILLLMAVVIALSSMKPEPLVISDVDFTHLHDGTYTGSADNGLVKAKVSVVIKNSAVLSISILEHDHLLGKAGEKIADEIIGKQSLAVDAITSATYSSDIIRKAVENALIGGK